MVKLKIKRDADGYITETSLLYGDTEVPDGIASSIMPGITKWDGGTELMYRCSVTTDADGYINHVGTDPAGAVDLYADELATVVPGATRLVDGHLVADADRVAALQAALDTPTPSAEMLAINALGLHFATLIAKNGGGVDA